MKLVVSQYTLFLYVDKVSPDEHLVCKGLMHENCEGRNRHYYWLDMHGSICCPRTALGIAKERKVLPILGPKSKPLNTLWPGMGPVRLATLRAVLAQFQTHFMLLRDEIRHNQKRLRLKSGRLTLAHVGSGRAQECSSHSSSCLLIAHVIPLRNSCLKTEADLIDCSFHRRVYRYL